MNTSNNPLVRFLSAPLQGQSYLNALHVWLAFPLGLVYFIFLVVGFSLGVPLIILWVGLLILLFVFAGWWLFAAMERWLAISLLRVEIPPMTRPGAHATGIWDQLVAIVSNPVTWKSLVYLMIKFPWGIICFTIAVAFTAVTGSLLVAPIAFPFVPLQVWWTSQNVWQIDTLPEALLAFVAGLVMFFVTIQVHNGLAWISGLLARSMLGNYQKPLAEPATITSQQIASPAPAVESVGEPFAGEPPAAPILADPELIDNSTAQPEAAVIPETQNPVTVDSNESSQES